MKKRLLLTLLLCLTAQCTLWANEPDSLYLFSYASTRNGGRDGLQLAYSYDGKQWKPIGGTYSFLKSDFGTWGAQKRMLTPSLLQTPQGQWVCLFSLNETVNAFAVAFSQDLLHWLPQNYYYVEAPACRDITVTPQEEAGKYLLAFHDNGGKYYTVETSDFKHFGRAVEVQHTPQCSRTAQAALQGTLLSGEINRVPRSTIERFINYCEARSKWNLEYNLANDTTSIRNTEKVEATLTIEREGAKKISDKLIGIFFEDINYAADGGLYAELIQNRDFEYSSRDNGHWEARTAWSLKGDGEWSIETASPLHPNNPHYALLTVTKAGETSLLNSGWDGIALTRGESYDFSIFARQTEGKGKLLVRLVRPTGEELARGTLTIGKEWKQYSLRLTPVADERMGQLSITPLTTGSTALDMISLFPRHTFKGDKNGLRADLAQALADLHPRFVRFPGGCVSHGNGIDNIYRWKHTIGPLESRKPDFNLWGYHQSMGLGFYEYFRFCEQIGAAPLPVLAAGVPCQNSSRGGDGQQCGIAMEDMPAYIQDILDLIEWANGDKSTPWGKERARAGHPAPFGLKYIGIGNEDLISDVFKERFEMIYRALKEKHPEITVIGTVGPFWEGADYEEGWRFASQLGVPMVDEHYYESPGWFLFHQHFYDNYDRSRPHVYVGEYAAHLPGRPNNIETALAEALHITSLERNGDVVEMASYAPLLAKEGHIQWNPDMIYFNNHSVTLTPGYYAQQMCGQNSGDSCLASRLQVYGDEPEQLRVASSVVRDSKSGDMIIKLVNMLPVGVTLHLQMDQEPATVTRTVLTGRPGDKAAKPVTTREDFTKEQQLLPYSFTVIKGREQ